MITLDVQVPVHYNVIKEPRMKTINATAARANLFSLLHEAHETDKPIMITTRNGEDAILLSEQTWRNLIETAYFYSIPGEVEALNAAAEESWEECISWDEIKNMKKEEYEKWLNEDD